MDENIALSLEAALMTKLASMLRRLWKITCTPSSTGINKKNQWEWKVDWWRPDVKFTNAKTELELNCFLQYSQQQFDMLLWTVIWLWQGLVDRCAWSSPSCRLYLRKRHVDVKRSLRRRQWLVGMKSRLLLDRRKLVCDWRTQICRKVLVPSCHSHSMGMVHEIEKLFNRKKWYGHLFLNKIL